MSTQPGRSFPHPAARAPIAASIAIAITVMAWASAFPLIRVGLQTLDPLPLAAARFGLAALIASAALLALKPKLPAGRDLATFAGCGAIGIAFYNALLNTGQQTVSPGAAAFIINTSPILTALLATVLLRERYGLWGWVGSVVAFVGVAVISAGQLGGLQFGAGASLILAAAACQASYFILQRPLVPRYGALACASYTIIAGAILLIPWLPSAIADVSSQGASTAIAITALAVIPSVIGYATWTYALDHFGASRAANFLYLVPPVAIGISFFLTGEIPSPFTIAGGILAIAGVAVVNLRRQLEGKVGITLLRR